MARVEVRPADGEARLDGVPVPVEVERGGLRLLLGEGLSLRALTFGERTRLTRTVAAGENSPQVLAAAILRLASDGAPVPAEATLPASILSLHLAGASSCAPGFAQEVGLLARYLGWAPEAISGAEATEIDALSIAYGAASEDRAPAAGDDGWVTLVLDGPTGQETPSGSLTDLRDELASDLLRRAQERPDIRSLGAPPRDTTATNTAASTPPGIPVPYPNDATVAWTETHSDNAASLTGGTDPAAVLEQFGLKLAEGTVTPALRQAHRGSSAGLAHEAAAAGARAAAGLATGAISGPRKEQSASPGIASSASAWRPSVPGAPGSVDAGLPSPESLARLYPAIFAAAAPALAIPAALDFAARDGGVVTRPSTQPEPAGQPPPPWAGSGYRPPEASPVRTNGHQGEAPAADPDKIARALHRAADLRGIAP